MSENIIEINDSNFEQEVIKSDLPVVVDFWAPWCGPCRMLWPVLEQIAQEYSSKVQIVKINVDEESNQQLAANFGVSWIPMVLLMKNWVMVDQFVWALPYEWVKQYVEKNI